MFTLFRIGPLTSINRVNRIIPVERWVHRMNGSDPSQSHRNIAPMENSHLKKVFLVVFGGVGVSLMLPCQ